jgi:opacity protein-like surface antigen
MSRTADGNHQSTRRTHMKTQSRLGTATLLAATLVLGGGAAQAATADSSSWYGGLQVSRSGLGLNGGDIDGALAGQRITGNSSIGRHDSGWGANLGYKLAPNIALEGGYTDLGDYKYNSVTTAPGADTVQGKFKAHAWSLAGIASTPLNDKWSLFGKAGVTRVTADLSAASTTGATAPTSQSSTSTGLVLGGGTTYDFTPTVFGKLAYDRYTHVGNASTGNGNIDLWTVGVGMRF